MFNHARTLLLNLPYSESSVDYIPENFNGRSLPIELKKIYDILFPPGTTRYFKQFLAHNYLNLIKAANLEEHLTENDTRIINPTIDYFKIYRHSNPKVSNTSHPIFVYGHYLHVNKNEYFYDNFLVTQVDDTLNITIQSTVNDKYYTESGMFDDPTEITLTFTNNVSNNVKIFDTGISIAISGTNSTFADTSDKSWEFIVEAPYVFEFEKIYRNLKNSPALNSFLKYNQINNNEKFINLWQQHPNPVYKMAGLVLLYISKVNNLS